VEERLERVDLPVAGSPGAAVVVGISRAGGALPPETADAFDVLCTTDTDAPAPWVPVASIDTSLRALAAAVKAAPVAALTVVQVLRATETMSVDRALVVESLAYSTLQHGEVFEAWLASHPRRDIECNEREPVRLERDGERLDVVLQRPAVHNAFDAAMRESLCDAFDLVALDPSIADVHLRGDGPSFCSGGDLREFGTTRDAALAHLIRTDRSVGRRIDAVADRVTVHLHGACIGAGIELAAFAGHVVAARDTRIRMPEVAMGLIPGAGGTVSLPRRIGRHRAAYLALTGETIDAALARDWSLVDAVE
jgi:hypothetical protein